MLVTNITEVFQKVPHLCRYGESNFCMDLHIRTMLGLWWVAMGRFEEAGYSEIICTPRGPMMYRMFLVKNVWI